MAVDFSEKDDLKLSEQLMSQMTSVGFCYVTNVKGHDEDKLLKALKKFFAISEESKMKLALNHFRKKNPNIYHGYFPFLKNNVSYKEFYQLSRPLSDYSDWEKQGCPLYHDCPWPENSSELALDEVLKAY